MWGYNLTWEFSSCMDSPSGTSIAGPSTGAATPASPTDRAVAPTDSIEHDRDTPSRPALFSNQRPQIQSVSPGNARIPHTAPPASGQPRRTTLQIPHLRDRLSPVHRSCAPIRPTYLIHVSPCRAFTPAYAPDLKTVDEYFLIFHSGTAHLGQVVTYHLFRSHLAARLVLEFRMVMCSPQWVTT